jgi:hypothetical protein
MPISSNHPAYNERLPQYIRCRDTVSGSDIVKAKGEEYLPRLSSQSFAEYEKYKQRGSFFSVSSRALAGLVGLASRREPKLSYPPEMTKYFEDTSETGTSFNELFIEMLNETMLMSRMFVMIDFPAEGGDPYVVPIQAESVINWHFEHNVLQWAVIKETATEFDKKDPFKRKTSVQYRLLSITDGVYHVSVFNDKEKLVSDVVPTVRNQPLAFIPGFFISPNGLNTDPVKPAMLDICDLNLTYYSLMTDYLNGLHLVAFPTPVITGSSDGDSIKMGPNNAIILPEPTSRAFFLEFNGQGLQAVEAALNTLLNQMALFSSRLSTDTGKGSESAVSVQLRYASESATLSAVVNAVQAGLTQVYNWLALFLSVEEPVIQVHKQFLNTKLTANEIAQFTQAYLAQAIDSETYYNVLFNGEVPVSDNVLAMQRKDLTEEAVDSNIPM